MKRPQQRRAGKRQVADGIHQLVTDELIRHAQTGGVQHPRLIDHDRVVQTAALRQAGGAQLVDFLGQRERAGARPARGGNCRASAAATAPGGRSPAAAKSIDNAMSRPVGARAQFGERVAVADADGLANLDRRPRRLLRDGAGAIQQEDELARRSRPGSAAPAHRPPPARCRCRNRPAPPGRARPCRSVRRHAASTVASRVSTTRSNRAGMSAPISVRRKTMP